MRTHEERNHGVELSLARQEARLKQTEVAALLKPRVHAQVVAAWEHGLSLPTESQRKQLEAMLKRSLPKQKEPRLHGQRAHLSGPLNRDVGIAEFASGLKELQRRLHIPSLRRLAQLLGVPQKTLTAAGRDELPSHIKMVIAAVLGWEARAGVLYGLLSAVQRAKVDAIAENLQHPERYLEGARAPRVVTSQALESAVGRWQSHKTGKARRK